MGNKKINVFLVISLSLLLALNAIYAGDDTGIVDECQPDTAIADTSSITTSANIDKLAASTDNDIASNKKTEYKNVKEDASIVVNNYNQLYDALTNDSYKNLSVELQGDVNYQISGKIELSESITNLRINANNRTLDGKDKYSFMKIQNPYSKVYISNINVVNCRDAMGGVIYNSGRLTVENSSFINNTATTEAGAILNYKQLTVNNCIFQNNNGGNRGGAISNRKNLTVSDSHFDNNTASTGGSIYLYGNVNVIIENNTLNNSSANFAGLIFTYGTGNVSIINNNISQSTARLYGGVVMNHGSPKMIFSSNKVFDCTAQWGAVIFTRDQMDINNNSFHNNTASYGGVIFNDGKIQLNENIFINNDAIVGGCIYNGAECTVDIKNNSFKNNTADDGSVIYNSGKCTFSDNQVISNTARNTDGYVIKSDTDLISEDAPHEIEIRKNTFINNTDYTRDMLLYNNATINISSNKYIGNYLDLSIGNLEKLSYVDVVDAKLNLTPSDRYNTTINTGKLVLNVNNKSYNFTVKNNSSAIHLNSQALDNQNTIKVSYNDTDRSFNAVTKTFNVSVYKNTRINVKTDKTVRYRDTLKIDVNVTDMDKKIVDKGYVIYKINGITLTDENGIIKGKVRNKTVSLDYQLPKNFNIKNYTLEVIYSGNPDNYNLSRNTTNFTIIKTRSILKVTSDKQYAKMDEKIKFTAVLDMKYPINEGVMIFKVNGVTIKDKNDKVIQVNVTNNSATCTFTIPDGWSAKPIKVTAVYSNKNFERLENNTYFNITRTTPRFNITYVKLTSNSIRVKGKLLDSYGHYVRGVNTIVIKVNSLTLKRDNDKPKVFVVENGIIDIDYSLLINLKKAEYTLDFVTGERNAYEASRYSMSVKNY